MGHIQVSDGRITSASDRQLGLLNPLSPDRRRRNSRTIGTTPRSHPYSGKKSKEQASGTVRFPSSLQYDGDTDNWPTTSCALPPPTSRDFFRIDDLAENALQGPIERERRAKLVKHWKKKIGTYIGNKLRSPDQVHNPKKQPAYRLKSFPPGYALFQQRGRTDPERRDAYLCGSNLVHQFRSPEEFYEHAEWLITGQVGVCKCQYCDKDYVTRGKREAREAPQ